MNPRFRTFLLVASALGVALILRAWGIDAHSFSMDEAAVVRDIDLPWASLLRLEDSFPPLYLALLKGWAGVFPGDLAARWLSVVLGTIAVLAVWGAGREIAGPTAGVVAAGLLAVSAFHVFYSQIVRPYSLYFTLAAVALWLFIRGARHNDLAAWLGFALVSTLGIYTHYYFVLLVALSFPALMMVRGRGAFAVEPMAAYIAVTVMSLTALPLLGSDLAYQTSIRPPRPLGPAAFGYTYYAMLTGFSLGPSKSDIYLLDGPSVIRSALPWIAVLGALLVAPVLRAVQALGGRRAALVGVLLLGPTLAAGALGYALGVTFNVRFVNWCLIPLVLLVAAGAASDRAGWLARGSVVGLALLQLLALHNLRTDPHYQTEDMRGVAAWLTENATPADPIFVCSDYMQKPLRHYLTIPWRVRGTPEDGSEIFSDPTTADREIRRMARAVRGSGAFWFVYSRPFHGDPDGHFMRALSESSDLVIEREFAGARLYRGVFPHSFTLAGN